MIRFLTTGAFAVDPAAASKVLTPAAGPVLAATIATVRALPEFTSATLEPALKSALVDELGFKPKVAFAPVRVAVTGRTISPPLYESMELLGRETTLQRLKAALDLVADPAASTGA